MSIPNVCAICRDEESVVSLAAISGPDHPDPHHFHLDCIHPWIDQRVFRELRVPECPLCRRTINQITLHDTDLNHTEIRVPLINAYNLAIAIITHNPERLAGAVQRSIPHYISPVALASAVRLGIMYENVPAVQTILENGRVDRRAFPSLLARAAESGNRNCVELILQYGAPFSIRSCKDAAFIARRQGRYSLAYRIYPEVTYTPVILLIGMCALGCLRLTRPQDLHISTAHEFTIELTPVQRSLVTLLLGILVYRMLHNAQNVDT